MSTTVALILILNLVILLLAIRSTSSTEMIKKYFIPELGFCFFVFVVVTIGSSSYKYKQFFCINGGPVLWSTSQQPLS